MEVGYTNATFLPEAAMTVLAWSDQLVLGHAELDETHREFVALLNAVGVAEGDDVLAKLDAFIAHTEAHFAQEEAWMEELQFPPRGCHGREHAGILEVAREVRSRAGNGDLHYGRTLAEALAEWFPVHASGMDAMFVRFMENPKIFEHAGGSCAEADTTCHAPESMPRG